MGVMGPQGFRRVQFEKRCVKLFWTRVILIATVNVVQIRGRIIVCYICSIICDSLPWENLIRAPMIVRIVSMFAVSFKM